MPRPGRARARSGSRRARIRDPCRPPAPGWSPAPVTYVLRSETEQVVEQVGQPAGVAAVEQVGDRAEQVPEQVARALLRGDGQVHLVEVHDESEQGQVQRAQ